MGATHYKLEELDRDKRDLYLSTWDHPEQFIPGEASWDDYRAKAGKLRASIDALNREIASLEDIENRIKGYKDDMDKLQGDIQETGLDFEDVKNSYRTVSKQELGACRQEVKEREAALQDADQAFQEAGKRIEKEKGGWENECRRIMERYGHEPADLKGVDLENYSQELEAEKGNLTGRIDEQEKRLNLLWQLQQEYQDQTEALSAEGLELTADPGWEPEREEKELACDARAPRRAWRTWTGYRRRLWIGPTAMWITSWKN